MLARALALLSWKAASAYSFPLAHRRGGVLRRQSAFPQRHSILLEASLPDDSENYTNSQPVVPSIVGDDEDEDLSYLDDEQKETLAKIKEVIAQQEAVYAEIRRLRQIEQDLAGSPENDLKSAPEIVMGAADAEFSDVPFSELRQAPDDDDDPYSGLTFAEIEQLEQEALEARLGGQLPGNKNVYDPASASAPPPATRQCRRYRFSQDEDWVTVEVPLPRAASTSDIQMGVGPDSFECSVKNAKELAPIAGTLQGPVDPMTVDFEVVAAPAPGSEDSQSGCQDPFLRVRMQKKPLKGTVDMWYGLLAGEESAPTVRFAWRQLADANSTDYDSIDSSSSGNGDNHDRMPARPTRRVAYKWKQEKDTLILTLDLGSGCLAGDVGGAAVTKKDVELAVAKDGRSMQVRVKDEMVIEGKLWGAVRPEDSTWFLVSDEDERNGNAGARKMMLEIELSKRALLANDSADSASGEPDPWWPSLLLGEDDSHVK